MLRLVGRKRRTVNICPALVVALLAGCGGEDGTQPNVDVLASASLSVVEGNAQADSIEATLATPVTVRLVDALSAPVPGALVNFVVVEQGCGEPFAGSALTDATGTASERWTLGRAAKECTMEARAVDADGTPRVLTTATATVLPGKPVRAAGESAAQWSHLPIDVSALGWSLRDRRSNAMPVADWKWPEGVPRRETELDPGSVRLDTLNALDEAGNEFAGPELYWHQDLRRDRWTFSQLCRVASTSAGWPDSIRVTAPLDSVQYDYELDGTRQRGGTIGTMWLTPTHVEFYPDSTTTIAHGISVGLDFRHSMVGIRWPEDDEYAPSSGEPNPTAYTGMNGCATQLGGGASVELSAGVLRR